MKTSTAYNHFTRLKSRMESVYSAAECYHPTHAHILERLTAEVFNDPALPKCPSWVRQGLTDYSSARLERIHRGLVVWLHKGADGRFKSYEALNDQERDAVNKDSDRKLSAHVWLKETTGRGTIADKNDYREGATITRSFEITGKPF